LTKSSIKRKKAEEEGMQEKKQQQQLLQNLGDQIDSSGDKNLDETIKAAFTSGFEARPHQVALIKLA
jgi:hypothetical protein